MSGQDMYDLLLHENRMTWENHIFLPQKRNNVTVLKQSLTVLKKELKLQYIPGSAPKIN